MSVFFTTTMTLNPAASLASAAYVKVFGSPVEKKKAAFSAFVASVVGLNIGLHMISNYGKSPRIEFPDVRSQANFVSANLVFWTVQAAATSLHLSAITLAAKKYLWP